MSMGRTAVVSPESGDSCEHLSQPHHIKTRHQRCACWGLEEERGTSVWREGTPGRYLILTRFPIPPTQTLCLFLYHVLSHRLPLPLFPYSTPPTSPEMVTPALLHTSAHTTPGYTLCPCAHSRWSGGGSPLGQEWAEVRGDTGSYSPGGSPYSCSVGPGRSLKMRGAHRRRETKALKLRGKQEGMPRRESSGKGPRGRQKAELGLQWEGAGEGGTSRGGGASGLRADGGRFALLS